MADDDIAVTAPASTKAEDSGNSPESEARVHMEPVHHERPHSLGLVVHMWSSPPALVQLPADPPAEVDLT